MGNDPNIKYLRPGEAVFYEGDVSNSLFLIHKGTVSIRKRKGSAFVELARLYSNEVLGELAFFDRQPRSASAFALTECELMEFSFDSLESIWGRVPDYFQTIIRATVERLRRANDTIRRLQNKVITEGSNLAEPVDQNELQPNAADILAATADTTKK